jgi:hypothetical protein
MAVSWLLAAIDFAAWPLVCIVCKSITSPCAARPPSERSSGIPRTVVICGRAIYDGFPSKADEFLMQRFHQFRAAGQALSLLGLAATVVSRATTMEYPWHAFINLTSAQIPVAHLRGTAAISSFVVLIGSMRMTEHL